MLENANINPSTRGVSLNRLVRLRFSYGCYERRRETCSETNETSSVENNFPRSIIKNCFDRENPLNRKYHDR